MLKRLLLVVPRIFWLTKITAKVAARITVLLALIAVVPLALGCNSEGIGASPSPAEGALAAVGMPGDSDASPIDLAQTRTNALRFENLSLEEGLSQSGVLAILQDRQGFMWFGTEDGLNKYDGYEFTVYKHDPDDASTLADNYVLAIYEDRNGDLWIGTRRGLDRLDRETETFIHYQHDPDNPQSLVSGRRVSSIYEDRMGMFWVGVVDGGLDRLDRATNVFTHYPHMPDDPTTLSDDSVHAIYEDRSGELWIGTDGGLNRFDRVTGTFTRYQHDPDDPNSLSDNRVRAVSEDREGGLWVGTEGGGLNRLDRGTEKLTRYQHSPEDPHSLIDNTVWAVLQDSTGALWIGTQNGLDRLDPHQDHFIHFRHDPNDSYSLSNDSVRAICEGRSDVLWIGTFGGGVSKYNRMAAKFALHRHRANDPNSLNDDLVFAICEDQDGVLWIGTFQGGLNRLDRRSNAFTVYQHDPADPSSLSSNDVRVILEDHTGVLWIGTTGGLDRLAPETETFIHYRHNADEPGSLSENRVRVIYEDRAGNIWVGTWNGGLNCLDRDTGTFVRYQHEPDDPFSLSDNHVRAIYEDREGMLWIGTLGGGISVLNIARNRFTHYRHDPEDPQSLSNDAVLSFYQDLTGAVWVATYGGGLNRLDRATQTFTHYTERDGLANDGVYSILADSEGVLWISTNKGLSKFDPRTETFRNYDVSDGLQSNEFNLGAAFRSDSGEMLFGGIQGLNAFYPEQVMDNPHKPPIVITAFYKLNEVVRTDLPANEHIQLSYKDDFVSFEFAALDYTAPEKNQYAYRLEGFDKDWVYAGTRRYASYTNLRGGDYVFRVKGSNNDGIWNEEGIAVHITVKPSFWATWWFRGIAALVLVGGTIGGYRLRVRGVEARSRKLEGQVEQRTAELQAERNFVAAILETAGGLVVVLDREGRIVRFNPACERTTGYSSDEVMARCVWDMLLVPEEVEPVKAVFGELRAGQFPNEAENSWVTKDGERRLIAWSNTALLGDEGEVEYIVGTGIDITERKRAEEALAQQANEKEALYRADEELYRYLDLDQVLQALVDIAVDILHADKSSLMVWDAGRERFVMEFARGFSPEFVAQMSFAREEGVIGYLVASGEPVVVEDALTDPRREGERAEVLHAVDSEEIRAFMHIPITIGDEVFGVFSVIFADPHAFCCDEQRLFVSLAQRAALAIENAHLFRAEQRRADQSRLISEVGRRITSILAVDELLEQMTGLIKEALGYHLVGIALIEGGELAFKAGAGGVWETSGFEPPRIKVGQEGITGWVAQSGEPLLVPDVSQEPRYYALPQASEVQSELAVPLEAKGSVIGVLHAQSDRLNGFDESDLVVLQSLAHQAAIAIDNARLYERAQELAVVKERQRLARDLHDAVTQTLFSTSLIAEVLPRIWERNPDEGRRRLEEVRQLTRGALAEMRTLLLELRPAALVEVELGDLLRQLAEGIIGRARVPVTVRIQGECSQISPDVKVALYRIAQEALNNVAKHAEASQATVSLGCEPDVVNLQISDDGRGFDVEDIPPDHLGVSIMRERAEAIGAALEIESKLGLGTQIVAVWRKDEQQGMENEG